MNETYEVLIRIAEAHATTYTTLEERSRAGEVEGHHTLVLVPDVNHAVELVVARAYIIYIKQSIPVLAEFTKCLVDFLGSIKLGNECMCLVFIDDLRCGEFLILLILDIAEEEHEVLALAWS